MLCENRHNLPCTSQAGEQSPSPEHPKPVGISNLHLSLADTALHWQGTAFPHELISHPLVTSLQAVYLRNPINSAGFFAHLNQSIVAPDKRPFGAIWVQTADKKTDSWRLLSSPFASASLFLPLSIHKFSVRFICGKVLEKAVTEFGN